MSEDIQKESASPHLGKPLPEAAGGANSDAKWPPYPKTVVAASILMIVAIGLFLASLVLLLVEDPSISSGHRGFDLMPGLVMIAMLAFPIWRGIQFIRGHIVVKDIRMTGWTCITMALGALLPGAAMVVPSIIRREPIWPDDAPPFLIFLIGIFILADATMLSVGVLFLIGRTSYRMWWKAQEARRDRGATDADNPFRK